MSQQRTELTQGQLGAINAVMDLIARNLGVHVNDTLSRAHGINGEFADYKDSAGDIVGNVVLFFDFGTPPNITRLFVPAIVTSGSPASTDTGLKTASALPGVPLTSTPLVSVFPIGIINNLNAYNDLLLAHAAGVVSDTGAAQVHGGITFSTVNTLDSLGHTVGNYLVTLSINGTAYNLVAESGVITGPPQPPRVLPFLPKSYSLNHEGDD